MPSATITLPNGTVVTIDGDPEEVAKLLQLYGGTEASLETAEKKKATPTKKAATKKKNSANPPVTSEQSTDLNAIVNLVKNCDEAEEIETKILDRASQVNRILLPLYFVHEHLENEHSLTSGEISQITKALGIPIQQPNVSRTLSGTASKYVMGDKVRKKGQAVRYKLSRRGLKYLQGVLKGTADD